MRRGLGEEDLRYMIPSVISCLRRVTYVLLAYICILAFCIYVSAAYSSKWTYFEIKNVHSPVFCEFDNKGSPQYKGDQVG